MREWSNKRTNERINEIKRRERKKLNQHAHSLLYQIVCVYRRCVNCDQYGLFSAAPNTSFVCTASLSIITTNKWTNERMKEQTNETKKKYLIIIISLFWLKLLCVRWVWEICICSERKQQVKPCTLIHSDACNSWPVLRPGKYAFEAHITFYISFVHFFFRRRRHIAVVAILFCAAISFATLSSRRLINARQTRSG